ETNNGRLHGKGSIAAGRQGDGINPERRSSGSQFYIVLGKVYAPLELTTNMQLLQESFMKYLQLKSNEALKQQYMDLYEQKNFAAMNSLILVQKDEFESYLNLNLDKII